MQTLVARKDKGDLSKKKTDEYGNASFRVPEGMNEKASLAAARLRELLGVACKTGDAVDLALDLLLEELKREDFLHRYAKRRSR